MPRIKNNFYEKQQVNNKKPGCDILKSEFDIFLDEIKGRTLSMVEVEDYLVEVGLSENAEVMFALAENGYVGKFKMPIPKFLKDDLDFSMLLLKDNYENFYSLNSSLQNNLLLVKSFLSIVESKSTFPMTFTYVFKELPNEIQYSLLGDLLYKELHDDSDPFKQLNLIDYKDIIFDNLNSLINKNILDNAIKGINVKKTMKV